MNVGALKSSIAAYLQIPVADMTVNGVDLALGALNRARRNAERFHDWNCEEATIETTAVDGKGSWQAEVDGVRLKQPQTFYLKENDILFPLYHHGKKQGAVWAKERIEARAIDRQYRYQDDVGFAGVVEAGGYEDYRYEMYVYGPMFELNPQPNEDKTVVIDGFKWLDNYTDDADTDFFTSEGEDYMMYAAIVELNLRFQTFIPRQEGSLSPPEKARDEALSTLIEYDNFIVQEGRQPNKR